MQEQEQILRDRIKDLIRGKKFSELEDLWLQIATEEKRSPAFHQAVGRYLINRKEEDRLAELYGTLLTERNSQGEHQQVFDISDLLLDLNPLLDFLRPHLITAIKGVYGDHEESTLNEFLRVSGLEGETPNVKQALERFQELAGASKGQVFRHSTWGLGVVRELDVREGWAILDFPRKPNHRMTLEGIRNFLRHIPPADIQAKIAKDKEGFKKEAFEDPAGTVRLALKTGGGKMKSADIKRLLTEQLFTDAEYKKWWGKAKDDVRLDPYVDMTGMGLNAVLVLRSEPRSFVAEVLDRFLQAKSLADRREVLREVARHGDNADMSTEDVQKLYSLYKQPLEEGKLTTNEEKFGHGVLFEEYSALFPDDAKNPVNVEEYLTHAEYHPGELIASLGMYELQRLALQHVLKLRNEEAEDIFAHVFFEADVKLATWMEKALANEGKQEVLEHCLERILADPDRNPELFAWAGRQVIDGQIEHVADSIPPMTICSSAATLLSVNEQRARDTAGSEQKEAKSIASRMRTILQDNHHKYLKKAIRQSTPEQAHKFLAHISLLGGLPNQLKRTMEDLVHYEQPDLRVAKAQKVEEESDELSFHYAFPESVDQKRSELSHILNVEIPENSKAIGVARELGDLRENAEYHAAKDRQKLLMQRAKELEELIAKARIVTIEQVRVDQIRFGTTATLRRLENGAEERYMLVGMWEADQREKISYLTPFGSQIMNRKPNEQFEVTLPDGSKVQYEVLKVEKVAQHV